METQNTMIQKEVKNTEMEVVQPTNKLVVEFNKTYNFEGAEYQSIDLSGLEELTTDDLIEADKIFASSGQMAMVNEASLGYLMIIASMAAKKPIEFFNKLPAKEAIKVKNKVMVFLNN